MSAIHSKVIPLQPQRRWSDRQPNAFDLAMGLEAGSGSEAGFSRNDRNTLQMSGASHGSRASTKPRTRRAALRETLSWWAEETGTWQGSPLVLQNPASGVPGPGR